MSASSLVPLGTGPLESDNVRPLESLASQAAAAAGAESTAADSQATGEPLVSAELADLLQDADTLDVLSVMRLAVSRGNPKVARYCAQVLKARLIQAAEDLA